MTYSVEVERGLPFEAREVARTVDATLNDPRGWTRADHRAFRRTDTQPQVRILLASPATTDRLCAPLDTRGEVSCRNGRLVVINARRWAYGAETFGADVAMYRRYVINHEMGHAIGHGHADCPRPGQPAPVMMQQTIGLQGCSPNPWPDLS